MASIARGTVDQNAEQTFTGDTAWHQALTAASSSFVAGEEYLFWVQAKVGGSTSANTFKIRAQHGGTQFDKSLHVYEPRSTTDTRKQQYNWFGVFTQPGGGAEAFDVEVANNVSTSDTVRVESLFLYWFKVGDLSKGTDGGAGNDYVHKFDASGPTAHIASTRTDRVSLAFTGVATDRWLILYQAMVSANNSVLNFEVVGKHNGSEVLTFHSREGEDDEGAEQTTILIPFGIESLASGEQTFVVATGDESSGTQNDYESSEIFALRLSAFEDSQIGFSNTSNPSQATSTTTLLTESYQPTTTGDQFVIGSYLSNSGIVADRNRAQITNDGTSMHTNQLNDEISDSYDGSDKWFITLGAISSFSSAAAVDIDVDANSQAGTPTGTWDQRQIIVFSMELASTGQFLRPDADITVAGWQPFPSSPTTLFDKIDETVPDASDYIFEEV